MHSLKAAQALLSLETQTALSLPTAALILGAVSQVDTVMEIVDRVCDPLFRGAGRTTTTQDTQIVSRQPAHASGSCAGPTR